MINIHLILLIILINNNISTLNSQIININDICSSSSYASNNVTYNNVSMIHLIINKNESSQLNNECYLTLNTFNNNNYLIKLNKQNNEIDLNNLIINNENQLLNQDNNNLIFNNSIIKLNLTNLIIKDSIEITITSFNNCNNIKEEEDRYFKCNNLQCININLKCDNISSCFNNTDELNCLIDFNNETNNKSSGIGYKIIISLFIIIILIIVIVAFIILYGRRKRKWSQFLTQLQNNNNDWDYEQLDDDHQNNILFQNNNNRIITRFTNANTNRHIQLNNQSIN